MRRETSAWVGRAAAALVLAGVLGYVPYHLYARSGLARSFELGRDLEQVRAANADLAAENAKLARQIDALNHDPEAVERVARRDLGWVKPGEVLFQIEAGPAADRGAATNLTAGVGGPRGW